MTSKSSAKQTIRLAKKPSIDHLKPESRQFFEDTMAQYVLEKHHVHLLILACEALDRNADARKILAEKGDEFIDRFGQPHKRPQVAIANDSVILFARLIRELGLDIEGPPPEAPRPYRRAGG